MKTLYVFTCEHATQAIPPDYHYLFKNQRALLTTHRGYDHGALAVWQYFCQQVKNINFCAEWSRLLIDLNRSPTNPKRFSLDLSPTEKADIQARYYTPYRTAIINTLKQQVKTQKIIHIACHSYTPVLAGKTRDNDIGILYDPTRPSEKTFAKAWQQKLKQTLPELYTRLNYPYRGNSDGLTTTLRSILPKNRYLGFELEINQKLFTQRGQPTFSLVDLASSFL